MTLAAKLGQVGETSIQLPSPSVAPARIAGLDELRGLSILWVLVCHGTVLWKWMPSSFSGYGFHGVVLFFIISGYLITRILIDSLGSAQFFRKFYLSRIFRIWPLMLLALAVSLVIDPKGVLALPFNLLMVNNYAYAFGIEPMVRTDVMWSLAIEEQYYLIWPAVAFLTGGKRAFAACAMVLMFLGLCFDSGMLPHGGGIIFKTTQGDMQYIAMGALLAFGKSGIRMMLAVWAVFFAAFLAKFGVVNGFLEFRWVWYGVTFVLGVLVAYTLEKRPLIMWSPLAYIGKICFGLYIIHFFISWGTLSLLGRGTFLPGAVYLALSFVLAALSFKYFEKPILDSRRGIIASDRKTVAVFAGMGLMILVCVVILIPHLTFARH